MSLYGELKRRNVIRVAVVYLVGGWLLTLLAAVTFPYLGVSDWWTHFLVIVLALGFLPTMVVAWLFVITPGGVIRDTPITQSSAKPLDVFIMALVIAALSLFLAGHFWFAGGPIESNSVTQDRVAANGLATTQYPAHSIAVLPFVNMSDDASNEYFSDGISEELLNLLARVHKLRVISRSSAFSFKGKDLDIPTIAAQLNVAHVLEGSVRRAGDRVRITVQLIDARSDTHLWSETFDRELDDIFAIQDEIASTVVEQLKVTLLGESPTSEEVDPAAYMLYLQARHLGNRGTATTTEQSIALYQQALAVEPRYASAWSGLANSYLNLYLHGQLSREESTHLAREASQRALELDADHAPAYAHLSRIELTYDRDLAVAAQHLQHALKLEPTNPEILHRAIVMAYRLGRMDDAIRIGKYTIERDPANPESHYYIGFAYLWAGQLDEALSAFGTTLMLSPEYTSAHYRRGVALLLKGQPEAALEEMLQEKHAAKQLEGRAIAYHALGEDGKSTEALRELIEKYEFNSAYNIAYVLAYLGENDRAFEWLAKAAEYRDSGLTQMAHQPEFANIHDDPRWLPALESAGVAPDQLAAIGFNVSLP
ncbi:MAG: tetratricopeptide repeat protein [Xanthomonadales bacterium]|nr:tetratricopeptide repeat protein [Xanthomonadales bacterium]